MYLKSNMRDPMLRRAWRMAAIYRCCLAYGKSSEWALSRIREISPDGQRDHMIDIWFGQFGSKIVAQNQAIKSQEALQMPVFQEAVRVAA